jgi:hypothetical protein
MKMYAITLGFITLCILLGVSARVIPQQQIAIPPREEASWPEANVPVPKINMAALLQQYRSRPLFISKLENTIDTLERTQQSIAEDWSPLDYQLIGISRTAGLTTGWFRHMDTGGLVSSRIGMQLGNWTLEYLSGTEARLSSDGKIENLKLFQREEPR